MLALALLVRSDEGEAAPVLRAGGALRSEDSGGEALASRSKRRRSMRCPCPVPLAAAAAAAAAAGAAAVGKRLSGVGEREAKIWGADGDRDRDEAREEAEEEAEAEEVATRVSNMLLMDDTVRGCGGDPI